MNDKKRNFFYFFKKYIKNTKKIFSDKIKKIFTQKKIDNNLLQNLENLFLSADFGVKTTKKVLQNFKNYLIKNNIVQTDLAISVLKQQLLSIIEKSQKFNIYNYNNFPKIILVVGVNGVGKTTTIAKIAYDYQQQGENVMLVAADTFRAAAINQIVELGKLYQIPVFYKSPETDPASVVFDAINFAYSKKINILLIDTAGRLHNKDHLMQELQKIHRVIFKKKNLFPHLDILLILDVCTGQNAIQQTKLFHKKIGITGIILTKLDGTAKGGIIFTLIERFLIPIVYISAGEKIIDLQKFHAHDFIDSLF